MAYDFLDLLATPAVRAAQAANGAAGLWDKLKVDRKSNRFTEAEKAFIGARDSFYIASVSQSGWPYVQHRGGPPGFLKVLDPTTLGFADFRGNRQYITLGNAAADDRVALILVDYPNRTRLKVLAHMTAHDLGREPDLASLLSTPGYRGTAERGFLLRLESFDWNCPQHITPRFSAHEVETATAPLRERLTELETENARLRTVVEQLAPGKPAHE